MSVRVLIVDDDPSFRDVATELLRTRGFDVVGVAVDGREAVDAVDPMNPDAVLLDVQLPGVEGLGLAAKLSRDGEGPRILLTSSDEEAVTEELAQRQGAVGFVPKSELALVDLGRYFSAAS
jgi:CheY-like chemotaxis protein